MGTITVGVDRSVGAVAALHWAAREAELRSWTVTAVLAWGFFDQQHSVVGRQFDPSYGETDALAALDEIVDGARGTEPTVPVFRRVVYGQAGPVLTEASASSDLLVVGTRGLGAFRSLLLGSVSQACLHHASCAVAIVGAPVDPSPATGRVVVGIDGSAASRRALGWALDEARLRHAPVDVVHAWPSPYSYAYPYAAPIIDPEIYRKAAEEVLDDALEAQDLTGLPGPITRITAEGGPARIILERSVGADLVVVGGRGLGGFTGLLIGSVTHQVAHHSRCPVVVIP
ncbi:MAG: universal stress protein [Acidimicrobiales bacterium]